ncbi:MAG: LuxR C-terminal-related transcriptional regulator [Acidimicrobiia bacterium]
MAASPPPTEALKAGRAALARGAWMDARSTFSAALEVEETPEALEGLSWAAWWLEDVSACLDARERGYLLYRQAADQRGAARMALWLGDDHIEFRGAAAVADGWFQRAARLLEVLEPSPEHGWLAVFGAHEALNDHDLERAKQLAGEARDLGRQLAAVDLEMFSLATEGLALVEEGDVEQGMRCLDEATAAALGGEYENLAPAAWTCCRLISACEQVRDYDRGAQWCKKVEEFSRRMGTRFVTGVCRAHYAAILTWHGRWGEAEQELVGATDDLTADRPFWLAEAVVRLGDLRRRQGRVAEAEELFERTSEHPLAQRGLAELCLDREDPATARDLLERLLRRIPPTSKTSRAGPLELLVRSEVALGDHESAAARLEELRSIADAVPTQQLRASVSFSEGLVAAVTDDHESARDHFEDALHLFGSSRAPVEAERARLELSRSLHALGRIDAAEREAHAALERLEDIGASVEIARTRLLLDAISVREPDEPGRLRTPLTARQVEVLRLVAAGLGDRDIAARLTLSEHTVHRHVANIYVRLGCSSRAAAVAQANRLGLL